MGARTIWRRRPTQDVRTWRSITVAGSFNVPPAPVLTVKRHISNWADQTSINLTIPFLRWGASILFSWPRKEPA